MISVIGSSTPHLSESRPSISDFCASKHARKGGPTGLDTALHPGASSAHSLGHVERAPLSVPALAQADANSKVAPRDQQGLDVPVDAKSVCRGREHSGVYVPGIQSEIIILKRS